MTGTIEWATGGEAGFAGLSSAVIALPAEHWEAFGATFVLDGSNPDWPQRIALGSASTPLEAVEPFAILDEGEVTTLLIGGTDERRAMRGLAVLFALAAGGCIDLDRDVLQIGIGDELGTAVLGGSSSAAHAAQRLASATLDPTEAVVVLTNNVIVSLDPAGTTPDGRELFTIAQASPLSARIHALAGAATHVEVLATTRAAVDHGELYVELMRRLRANLADERDFFIRSLWDVRALSEQMGDLDDARADGEP